VEELEEGADRSEDRARDRRGLAHPEPRADPFAEKVAAGDEPRPSRSAVSPCGGVYVGLREKGPYGPRTQAFSTSRNGCGARPMTSVPAAQTAITAVNAYELRSFDGSPSAKNIAAAIRK